MKTIATLILASSFSTCSYAQTASPSPVQRVTAKEEAQRDMRNEVHIKALHAKLKITAAEEPLWQDVARTMRENAVQIDQIVHKREAGIATATAIEDMNAYGEIAQAHADSVKKLSLAFAPLYAAMPDMQKKLTDEVFTQRGHKDHMHRKMDH